jgi:NAD(P)-dependent dehydrogenase (short-subunit alcohol dehydrogenase family)
MRVCIVGASGKLGQYMVQHALDRGYEVAGVCREESVAKLDRFNRRITILPGATNDAEVIKRAVAGCDGILVVRRVHPADQPPLTRSTRRWPSPAANGAGRTLRPPSTPLGCRDRRLGRERLDRGDSQTHSGQHESASVIDAG